MSDLSLKLTLKERMLFSPGFLIRFRKLLGPLPEYASEEFIKWREEIVEKRHILAKSQEFDPLKAELLEDENMNSWMTADEISFYLQKQAFDKQQSSV